MLKKIGLYILKLVVAYIIGALTIILLLQKQDFRDIFIHVPLTVEGTEFKLATPQPIIEKAYYLGQVAALNGDVRVNFKNGKYVWSKTPWESKQIKTILYDPEMDMGPGVISDNMLEGVLYE